MELVSAAREYETRSAEPSLAGFVDQLSLLSDVDEEAGTRHARVLMMTMHSAKALEFPVVVIAGLEEGLFRIPGRPTTKGSSRKNDGSATSASRGPSDGWCSRPPHDGGSLASTSQTTRPASSMRFRVN